MSNFDEVEIVYFSYKQTFKKITSKNNYYQSQSCKLLSHFSARVVIILTFPFKSRVLCINLFSQHFFENMFPSPTTHQAT